MSDLIYENLPVGIRKSADGARYEAGVTIDGGFVAFAAFGAGAFEDDLAEAQENAKAEAASSEPAA